MYRVILYANKRNLRTGKSSVYLLNRSSLTTALIAQLQQRPVREKCVFFKYQTCKLILKKKKCGLYAL